MAAYRIGSRILCQQCSKGLHNRHTAVLDKMNRATYSTDVTLHHMPIGTLSEQERMFQESARKFAAEHVRPHRDKYEAENGTPSSLVKQLFDNGFLSILMPEQYGGAAANLMSMLLAGEEMCRADMGVGTMMINHNILASGFFRYLANDEQKERFFGRLSQSAMAAASISEAEAGSDAFAMKATAKKSGDYYILNGTKMWVTSADHADLFVVMANIDPSQGYRGITCFVIERATEGFTIGPKVDKMGIRASGTCPLFMDNVKVHKSNVLGEVGKGYKYSMMQLGEGRLSTGIQAIGVARSCIEDTIEYLTQRKQFGKQIWQFQAIQHQVSDAITRLEASQLLVYNTVRRQENGLPFTLEASMAKYYSTETLSYIASKCVDWMGGVGFTKSYPQEKYYRDCKIAQIYEGTNNIQLNTIAKFWEKTGFTF